MKRPEHLEKGTTIRYHDLVAKVEHDDGEYIQVSFSDNTVGRWLWECDGVECEIINVPSSIFKYEIGDKIYYIFCNKICYAPIQSRMIVENHRESKNNPFGNSRTVYSTVHGIFNEYEVFLTFDELFVYLKKGLKERR